MPFRFVIISLRITYQCFRHNPILVLMVQIFGLKVRCFYGKVCRKIAIRLSHHVGSTPARRVSCLCSSYYFYPALCLLPDVLCDTDVRY